MTEQLSYLKCDGINIVLTLARREHGVMITINLFKGRNPQVSNRRDGRILKYTIQKLHGRLKPDISSAPILSTKSRDTIRYKRGTNSTAVTLMGGTSMATPLTAGEQPSAWKI